MTHGLFEVLAADSEQERIERTRATIAITTRAKDRFEKYVSKAATQEEREARIEIIASDLDKIAEEVVLEHHFITIDEARAAGREALGGGHASDCSCGFCKNKGKLPGSDKSDDDSSDSDGSDSKDDDKDDDKDDKSDSKKPWESSVKTAKTCPECESGQLHEDDHVYICSKCGYETSEPDDDDDKTANVQVRQSSFSAPEFPWEHTAAGVETGDSYTQETVSLPSNKTDGLGGPSPKIDKGTAGGLKPIDVPSKRNPTEQQSVTDTANYDAKDFDASSGVSKQVDADKTIQPEHNVADNTKTWTGTEGQADPVTSAVLAKWSVLT